MAKIRTRTTLFRDSKHRVPFHLAYRHRECNFFLKISNGAKLASQEVVVYRYFKYKI